MLEKKSPEKITTMLEVLVGLLRNAENCSNRDVEVSIFVDIYNIFRFTLKSKKVYFTRCKRSILRLLETQLSTNISILSNLFRRVLLITPMKNFSNVHLMLPLLPGLLNLSYSAKTHRSKLNAQLESLVLKEIWSLRKTREPLFNRFWIILSRMAILVS